MLAVPVNFMLHPCSQEEGMNICTFHLQENDDGIGSEFVTILHELLIKLIDIKSIH
jgi:hypothetical protein